MSSDEDDGPREEPQSLDDNGYPVMLQASTGGKLQAQLNPLQLKMAAMKAAAEDKAKKDAKKAALASRAAAFGSIKDDGKGAKAVEEPKAAVGSKVPELEKARLDGKVVDMMRSGIVTKTRVIGRGGAAGARGRGRGAARGGRSGGVDVGENDSVTDSVTSPTTEVDSDDSDDEEAIAKRRAAAQARVKALAGGASMGSKKPKAKDGEAAAAPELPTRAGIVRRMSQDLSAGFQKALETAAAAAHVASPGPSRGSVRLEAPPPAAAPPEPEAAEPEAVSEPAATAPAGYGFSSWFGGSKGKGKPAGKPEAKVAEAKEAPVAEAATPTGKPAGKPKVKGEEDSLAGAAAVLQALQPRGMGLGALREAIRSALSAASQAGGHASSVRTSMAAAGKAAGVDLTAPEKFVPAEEWAMLAELDAEEWAALSESRRTAIRKKLGVYAPLPMRAGAVSA